MNASDYVGRESGPGKFEGETGATEYFYDAMLDGDGEDFDDGLTGFSPTEEEVEAFGDELNFCMESYLVLHFLEEGFVTLHVFRNEEEARKAIVAPLED